MTLAKEVLFLQLTIGVVALITVGLIVDDRAKQSKERSAPAQPVHVVEGKVIQKGDNTFVLSDEPDPRCEITILSGAPAVLYVNVYSKDNTVCCVGIAGNGPYDIGVNVVYNAKTMITIIPKQDENQTLGITYIPIMI